MRSKNMNNYSNNNEEFGNKYSNNNYPNYKGNYNYENNYNNRSNYNNVNNYNNPNYYYNQNNNNYQYNNNFNGKIISYYNNYPVYSTIPASVPNSNKEEQDNNNYVKKESKNLNKKPLLRSRKSKGGIVLSYNPQEMCHLRAPEYAPGYVPKYDPMNPGRPAYGKEPSK